jgi:hypothetical protein
VLAEPLEKAGEGDFLRAVAEAVLQLLMESDVEGLIGAGRYERSGERTTWRNGHRDRTLDTRLGSLQLRIPKLRQGSYFPPFLEARKSSEKALTAVIQEAWIGGVSTRRVDDLVQAMGLSGPRLHPRGPCRASHQPRLADYVATFAGTVTATAYADTEAEYNKAAEQIPVPFERLEKALERQGSGPFFNGTKYSLVDAAYAPFLQRYVFLDRVKKLGHIEKFPRLKAWCEALLNRTSTHSFPPAEFEAL